MGGVVGGGGGGGLHVFMNVLMALFGFPPMQGEGSGYGGKTGIAMQNGRWITDVSGWTHSVAASGLFRPQNVLAPALIHI